MVDKNNFLDTLRKEPEDVRRGFALFATFLFTVIIAVTYVMFAWLGGGEEESNESSEERRADLLEAFDHVSSEWSEAKESLPKIKTGGVEGTGLIENHESSNFQ